MPWGFPLGGVMKRRILVSILSAVCFLTAVIIMLYPAISNYVNQKYASEIHTAYVEQLRQADGTELRLIKDLAHAYNQSIVPGAMETDNYTQAAILAASEDYDSQLNPTGDGTMGYIEIPKINVNLPILHGTNADTLERGVGHLLGSSLPVGGSSTHAILTGHSGMASQKMFTDLAQLGFEDVFYVHLLKETLAYQVDEINTVLPHDTTYLQITPGEDYCTLVTCTPVGINTHRLLVRGHRIPYEEAKEVQEEQEITIEETGSDWEDQYRLGLLLGLIIMLLFALGILLRKLFLKYGWNKLYSKGGRYLCEKD